MKKITILIAILFGLLFGIFSALNKDSFLDHFIQFISTLGISIPSFFSAIIFAWILRWWSVQFTIQSCDVLGSRLFANAFFDSFICL